MIETCNMFEDLRNDNVGKEIMAMRALLAWNSEKHALKEKLFQTMTVAGYTSTFGNAHDYRLSFGIGFSYLYQVPINKRGKLKTHRGKLIRIVHESNRGDASRFMFGQASDAQLGRSYHSIASNPDSADFDVRLLYRFAFGEWGYSADAN